VTTNHHSQQIVQKLWSYCNLLRDDGLSYGDYVEQLTYLLFLKMAYERTQPPWQQASVVPDGLDWPSLMAQDGDALETHYRHLLQELGRKQGMLGVIFRKAQNKIQDPAKLRRLIVDLIDREQWMILDADVKGDAYEGLLEKNAQDTKPAPGNTSRHAPSSRPLSTSCAPHPEIPSAIHPAAPAAFCWRRMTTLPGTTPTWTGKKSASCASTPCTA
jgi:type I restriction enzyme M protein